MKKTIQILMCLIIATLVIIACSKKDSNPATYTLTTSVSPADGGTILPPSGTYESGRTVTLTATPAANFTFKNWSDGASGTTNPVTLTINSNISVTAVFEEVPKTIPGVTTSSITSITTNSATSGGNITSDGNATVTACGVCWSTSENPTISDNKTSNSSGTGNYISTLTGLTPGTTYYVRAYAINSVGTAYGNQVNFNTLAVMPEITTVDISGITETSAISGGNITDDGGASVTARGVCWSTSENPTIDDNKTSDGTGTGSYASSIKGLTPGTTYYVKSYATNSEGTAYGNQLTFETIYSGTPPTGYFIDSRDGKEYAYIEIGNQTWMAENLAYLPEISPSSALSNILPYYYVHGYLGTNVNEAKATTNYNTYGVLYNWPAAMAGESSSDSNPSGIRGVCPSGWHLPSDAEWTELSNYLINNGYGYGGSGDNIGKALASTSGWSSYPLQGTVGNDQVSNNSSGFTGLSGGFRGGIIFYTIGGSGGWWSATEYISTHVWYRYLNYRFSNFSHSYDNKEDSFSVRCVRDN